jgi:hypothetical protein
MESQLSTSLAKPKDVSIEHSSEELNSPKTIMPKVASKRNSVEDTDYVHGSTNSLEKDK